MSDWDLVFPDDEREANPTSFKFLQMAQAWAAQKNGGNSSLLLSGLVAQASKSKKQNKHDVDANNEAISSDSENEN